MYLGNVIMMIGAPPALGSYWGLLQQELAGYREYMDAVRYRLVPYVW